MANSLQIEPFSIDKEDVVIVKPSKPTPSDVLSLSTIDNDHNLEILCQTIYVYKAANNNISSNGSVNGTDHDHPTSNHSANWQAADPACVIKEALSRVLVYYYPLAGKLKRQKSNGRLQLTCTADGVPFLVATANCELSSLQYLDGIHVEIANKFVFNMPAHPEGDDDGNHPLLLQVTKFSCGGFTIGMGVYHSVVDGFGAAQFFRAMAELASGKSEPSVKPVWERERLLARIPTVQAGTVSPDLEDFTVFKVSKATSPYLLWHAFSSKLSRGQKGNNGRLLIRSSFPFMASCSSNSTKLSTQYPSKYIFGCCDIQSPLDEKTWFKFVQEFNLYPLMEPDNQCLKNKAKE